MFSLRLLTACFFSALSKASQALAKAISLSFTV